MGVIKQQFCFTAVSTAQKKMHEMFDEVLERAGLSSEQIDKLIKKVVQLCADRRGNKYTVMVGYPASEQLFDDAKKAFWQMDEAGTLVELLGSSESPEDELNQHQQSETDLEDVYQMLEAVEFTGTPKQCDYARAIAEKNIAELPRNITISEIPTDSVWWINNKDNIYSAIRKECQ